MQKINAADTSTNSHYDEKVPQPPKNISIDAWVVDIRKRRAAIFERRNSRKQRKQDLAKRRTVAAQERMRIISQLARKEKDDDDFGMRDEDWDVYKAISKDDDSDSDAENEKLIEFDNILRYHDPTFEEPQIVPECAAENYQVCWLARVCLILIQTKCVSFNHNRILFLLLLHHRFKYN